MCNLLCDINLFPKYNSPHSIKSQIVASSRCVYVYVLLIVSLCGLVFINQFQFVITDYQNVTNDH